MSVYPEKLEESDQVYKGGLYQITAFFLSDEEYRIHHYETHAVEDAHALGDWIEACGGTYGVMFTPNARMKVVKTTDTEWIEH